MKHSAHYIRIEIFRVQCAPSSLYMGADLGYIIVALVRDMPLHPPYIVFQVAETHIYDAAFLSLLLLTFLTSTLAYIAHSRGHTFPGRARFGQHHVIKGGPRRQNTPL